MAKSEYTGFLKKICKENSWNLRNDGKKISLEWSKFNAKKSSDYSKMSSSDKMFDLKKKIDGDEKMGLKEKIKIGLLGKPNSERFAEPSDDLEELKYNIRKDLQEGSKVLPLKKSFESFVKHSSYETELKAVTEELLEIKKEYVNKSYEIISSDFSRRFSVLEEETKDLKNINSLLYSENQALKQRISVLQEKLGKAKNFLGEL